MADVKPVEPHKPKRNKQAMRTPIVSTQRLLDIQDVVDFTRFSESTIERLLADDDFPKPIWVKEDAKRSARRWTLGAIEQWVRRRQQVAEQRVA